MTATNNIREHILEYVDQIVHERASSKSTAPYYAVWAMFHYMERNGLRIVSVDEVQCASCPTREFSENNG